MDASDFRRLALALPDSTEGSHMAHPDFRVGGRIFATLQGEGRGMVKLPPEEQQRFQSQYPGMFTPENGAWGRQGCTRVHLACASTEAVGEAMTLAWQAANRAPDRTRRPGLKKNRRKASGTRRKA